MQRLIKAGLRQPPPDDSGRPDDPAPAAGLFGVSVDVCVTAGLRPLGGPDLPSLCDPGGPSPGGPGGSSPGGPGAPPSVRLLLRPSGGVCVRVSVGC